MLLLLSLAALAGPAPTESPEDTSVEVVPSSTVRGEVLTREYLEQIVVRSGHFPTITVATSADGQSACVDGTCPVQLTGTAYLSADQWEKMGDQPAFVGNAVDGAVVSQGGLGGVAGQVGWTAMPGTHRWAGALDLTVGVQPGTRRIGGVAPAVRLDGVELMSNEVRTGRF